MQTSEQCPCPCTIFFLGAIPFQEVFFEMLAEMQNYDELELIVTKIKMIDKGTGHTK